MNAAVINNTLAKNNCQGFSQCGQFFRWRAMLCVRGRSAFFLLSAKQCHRFSLEVTSMGFGLPLPVRLRARIDDPHSNSAESIIDPALAEERPPSKRTLGSICQTPMTTTHLGHFLQQYFRLLQIRRIKSLRKPVVNLG